MKKICFVFIVIFNISLSLNAQITFGNAVKINKDWKFRLDSLHDYSKPGASYEDRKWRNIDLPHDWSIESKMSDNMYSCTGYLPGGIGWYRKTIVIPKSERIRKQFLYFGGIYCNSEVWINGHYLGKRPNGYVSFIYDITPYVIFGKKNCITVKVDHSDEADSRWYTGSGIYRDVFLVSSNYVHIDNWGIFVRTSKIDEGHAEIDITTRVVNEDNNNSQIRIHHKLYKKGTSDVVAEGESTMSIQSGTKLENAMMLKVHNPMLWELDSPSLYILETIITDDKGNYIDGTKTTTGIRMTEFDPNYGFFLNGKNTKMKGVCLHHDAGALGAAVPKSVWRRRLSTLKSLGVNAIRMSHNLQDELLYDLCDELGFMVIDEAFDEWEFPKRKWLQGWNVGKNPGYQGYAEYFDEWAKRDLTDMVQRDKNHPSVILWSIGNEVDYPNDPYSHPILDYEGINQKTIVGYKPEKPNAERIGYIAEEFVDLIKAIDSSRAVTGAMAGVVMSNFTKYPYVLDVTGYNYTENRYLTDHIKYPDRVIYGSENRHEYPYWTAVRDNDFIFGQFLWTGIDYLGESGPYPSRGFICGLLDLGGFVKPRGMYRKILWKEDEPMAFIGTIRKKDLNKKTLLFDLEPEWNYNDGDTIRVACFSNCDTLKLELNGKGISKEPKHDVMSNAYYWDIAYEPGTLRLEAVDKNGCLAQAEVITFQEPDRLTAFVDKAVADVGGDVFHVELNLLDKNGVRVLNAEDLITCKVEGAGELIRMENASPVYTGPYISESIPLYKGRLLAYFKTSTKKGTMKINFKSANCGKECSLKVLVK